MPYDEANKIIHTKVIGVTEKEVNDKQSVRQVILKQMFDEPELVDFIYLFGMAVKVQFDGREFDLGTIKSKYENILLKNPSHIKSWKITGGYPVQGNAGHGTKILGHETNNYYKINANYGINLSIQVL